MSVGIPVCKFVTRWCMSRNCNLLRVAPVWKIRTRTALRRWRASNRLKGSAVKHLVALGMFVPVALAAMPASAKGCLKGVAMGAVAGHMVEHHIPLRTHRKATPGSQPAIVHRADQSRTFCHPFD